MTAFAREKQVVIGYVVYSQVLRGAAYMDIAGQLEIHAKQELEPWRIRDAKQIRQTAPQQNGSINTIVQLCCASVGGLMEPV